jgi:hypothetical protein
LLNERGLDEALYATARRALADGATASVVGARLAGDVERRNGFLGSPAALLAIERLRALLRAGDELARTRDDGLVWILPDTSAEGAIGVVGRARLALVDMGTTMTAGVCDLAAAGDAPSLYALADRALVDGGRQGLGTTASYPPRVEPSSTRA